MNWLLVAFGSALGGMGRYGCTTLAGAYVRDGFPWGTLAVNVIGSALIGLLATTASAPGARLVLSEEARQFLMIGVLGGFTTFSSFSLQTLGLLQEGRPGPAAAYAAGSLALCLLGVWAGFSAGLWLNR